MKSSAKFPVFDVHTHWGKLLLGEEYEKRYDTAAVVAALQACGVYRAVNLDLGFSARERARMLENMIAANPDTTFIIAHFGSYSENLKQVGIWLDKYPNMHVDIAARISELGRHPYTAKRFLEKYCDRILFGTDFAPVDHVFHPNYYRFLETDDEYFNPEGEDAPYGQGRWNIYGIDLSDHALERIYCKNAEKLLCGK